MNKFYLLISLWLMILSCVGDKPIKQTKSDEQNTYISDGRREIQVVVFVDHSGTAKDNFIPKLDSTDLIPVVEEIQRRGGFVCVGKIGVPSRDHLARFPSPGLKFKLPAYPQREGGESPSSYSNRIDQWVKLKNRFSPVDWTKEYRLFTQQLSEFTTYDSYDRQSDVSGCLELGTVILGDGSAAQKYLIMVTDGINNGRTPFPSTIPEGISLIVVNKHQSSGGLDPFPHTKFVSIPEAISSILNPEL